MARSAGAGGEPPLAGAGGEPRSEAVAGAGGGRDVSGGAPAAGGGLGDSGSPAAPGADAGAGGAPRGTSTGGAAGADPTLTGGAAGEAGGSATETTFGYAVIPTSLVRERCLYDAARLAVYTNNVARYFGPDGTPRIERHRFVHQAWVTDSLQLNGPPRDIALTRDHSHLIALSPSTIYHIDLATWTVEQQFDMADLADYPYDSPDLSRLAVSGENTVLVSFGGQHNTIFSYDLTTHTLADETIEVPSHYGFYGSIMPVASADGSRILFGQNGVSPPLPLFYYDTALAKMVTALTDLPVGRMSYDSTGTTALIDGSLYDRQFQLKGAAGDLVNSVISPDGTRGYGYVQDVAGLGGLRTYDLTSATEGKFQEAAPRIDLADAPGDFATLGISDDGHTVFVSGEANFIVQPVGS
jgi:hypothetical protein